MKRVINARYSFDNAQLIGDRKKKKRKEALCIDVQSEAIICNNERAFLTRIIDKYSCIIERKETHRRTPDISTISFLALGKRKNEEAMFIHDFNPT